MSQKELFAAHGSFGPSVGIFFRVYVLLFQYLPHTAAKARASDDFFVVYVLFSQFFLYGAADTPEGLRKERLVYNQTFL